MNSKNERNEKKCKKKNYLGKIIKKKSKFKKILLSEKPKNREDEYGKI